MRNRDAGVAPEPASGPWPRLHRVLLALHTAAMARPRLTLALTVGVMAALATQVPGMRILLSMTDLAEESLPSTRRNREFRDAFGGGTSAGVIFTPSTPGGAFTPAQMEAIARWLEQQKAGNDDLLRVTSPFDLRRLDASDGPLRGIPVLPERDPDSLRALAASPWAGILTDTSGRDVGAEIVFREAPPQSRFGHFDPRVVGNVLRSYTAALLERESGIRAHLTGPAAFEYHSVEGIARFRILNVMILVMILALFRLLLGTWRSGGMMIGVLIVAGFVVYGSMSLAGSPIDLLSTGLFLMISVASLEDFLFVSHRRITQGEDWQAAFRSLLVPSLFTSLTTALGFGSLCVSGLSIIRRFGFWAAFGSIVEWLLLFIFLPAVMEILPPCRQWTDPRRAWLAVLPAKLTGLRPPRRLLTLLLGLYLLGIFAAPRLSAADSPARTFPEAHPYRQALAYLERSRGWVGEISVVFPPGGRIATNRVILEELAHQHNVAKVLDPYETVAWMTDGLSDDPALVATLGFVAPERFRSILSADGRVRAILYVRDVTVPELRSTLSAVNEACSPADCFPAGELASYADFASQVPSTLFSSFATCLVLVGSVLAVLLRPRGLRASLGVIASAFWGPVVMLVVLWALQVPMGFLTCVFASAIVGLTGDNAIQYHFAAAAGRLEEGVARCGPISVQVGLVMAAGCLWFLGSTFAPSRILGVLLGAGFLLSLFGDLWILRAILDGRTARR